MRIAYLSDNPPMDVNIWSGTPSFIYKTLCKYHDVTWIGGGIVNAFKWYHKYHHENVPYYTELYVEKICRVLSKEINSGEYDVILTCNYYMVSKLRVDIPVIFYSDTVFDDFKPWISNKNESYHKLARTTEQKCLERADAIIFSSEWAKRSAIKSYNISDQKIHVIEFGANIPTPDNVDISSYNETCNLVFIGKAPILKGVDIVIETYKELKRRGFKCQLTIVGCDVKMSKKDGVEVYPHLDKNNKTDLKQFDRILRKANFLILPTKFDAFGIVFCEASAYGVPSIAPNVGGVSQPIKNGKNGILLSPLSPPVIYADKIIEIYSDKKNYLKMRKTSLMEFNKRLNWDSWCKKLTIVATEAKKKKNNSVNKDFYIPTYVLDYSEKKCRRCDVGKEFRNREEFDVTTVNAIKHPVDSVGLWKSLKKCINIAVSKKEDIIIICKDDHVFSDNYSKDYLVSNIIGAGLQGIELLFGGVDNYGTAVPIATNRYWLDNFRSIQFAVFYKPIFDKILKYKFKETDDVDAVLSLLSQKCCVVYPFISKQQGSECSDFSSMGNSHDELCAGGLSIAEERLEHVHSIYDHFVTPQMLNLY